MGQATAGVLGAAIGRGGKAVAVVGDGAMLMNSEVSTAVQYRVPAVWVVLNDAGYGMIAHGMRAQHAVTFVMSAFSVEVQFKGCQGRSDGGGLHTAIMALDAAAS